MYAFVGVVWKIQNLLTSLFCFETKLPPALALGSAAWLKRLSASAQIQKGQQKKLISIHGLDL
jgi:hypothetical protein